MESICKVWNICGNYMNTWNIWKTHRFPSTYEYMEKCEYMEDMWNIYGNYMETIWKNIWENMGEHIENMISVVYVFFFYGGHLWKIDGNTMNIWRFAESWRYPKMDGLFHGQSHNRKWMITRGTPISGNLQMMI